MTSNDTEELMLSICCITYNHEKYIEQSLESFLMQETTFKYEILIGEDYSTDATRALIEAYIKKYPGRINLITHEGNVGAIKNQLAVLAAANGKYIAMCDGDDFWTDVAKLQKQVDFLEKHPDYVICCHHTEVIDEQEQQVYCKKEREGMEFSYHDLLLGRREETRTCSMVMRNIDAVNAIGRQAWYHKSYGADTLFKLYALAASGKKIYVLPDLMACYRLHTGGVWSMIDSRVRKRRMIMDFNLMIRNFRYSTVLRKALLRFYLKRYFLFDLRTLKLNSAWTTISSLL
ncbi:hypothetical protein PBAL39_01902 [Pedobacter sp. BAL39]|uniref:glycosyltransferase family 2 protein n=1 Tax=Pedobacter sp. BAL39 TaxID=391596 RepID=UPI0001559A9A|nr:glycosyltransferase [Pedobacter sp. BAL39]EDM38329.1 hypothetical protein PBAL39_01902 [Pedobacter sp. BAL39]